MWNVIGQAVPGTDHLRRKIRCQDTFRYCTFGKRNEWLVIAVSDGAGSARHSHLGSWITCQRLVKSARSRCRSTPITDNALLALFYNAREELCRSARKKKLGLGEFACTALFALVGPESATFAQIGDGAIVYSIGDDFPTVFWPDHGEYVNSTYFLTSDSFERHIRFMTISEPLRKIALLTDGLQSIALDYAARTGYAPFFRPMFDALNGSRCTPGFFLSRALGRFLRSDRVNQRTDDDKTLVLARRRL